VRLIDGQVVGIGVIPKGVSYSTLKQLSNEPLFTFLLLLQANFGVSYRVGLMIC